MSEQKLNGAEIGPGLQQVRREAMALCYLANSSTAWM